VQKVLAGARWEYLKEMVLGEVGKKPSFEEQSRRGKGSRSSVRGKKPQRNLIRVENSWRGRLQGPLPHRHSGKANHREKVDKLPSKEDLAENVKRKTLKEYERSWGGSQGIIRHLMGGQATWVPKP